MGTNTENANKLYVFKEKRFVGTLYDFSEGPVFQYSEEWLATRDSEPLSPQLPLLPKKFAGDSCLSFFENVIAEGPAKEIIQRAFHSSGMFSILKRFGKDIAGAYQIEDNLLSVNNSWRYIEIADQKLKELLKADVASVVGQYPGYRISLAGAQNKIACFKVPGSQKLYIPVDGAPSTHILKPDIFHVRSVRHSALNEAFILSLAENMGLPSAKTSYLTEFSTTLIERFDRIILEREIGSIGSPDHYSVKRIQQLDACQLLGITADKKYEEEKGPDFATIVQTAKGFASDPAACSLELVKGYVFSALVGNMDHHAKNISFFYANGKIKPTPLYDLCNTFVYENTSRKLAFKIGGEFRPNLLTNIHWARFAREIEMSQNLVFKIVKELTGRISQDLQRTQKNHQFWQLNHKESVLLEQISRDIVSRAQKWERGLGMNEKSYFNNER